MGVIKKIGRLAPGFGLALVIAALAAEGTSEISGVSYIERGYESIETALRSVGADIKKV